MQNITFYQKNSGFIQIVGLVDNSLNPPQYVNNALNARATLVDIGGTPVSGFIGVAGVYVNGSKGTYNFPVSNTFAPPAGAGYVLIVDVVAPSTAAAHWEIPAVVAVRGTSAGSS